MLVLRAWVQMRFVEINNRAAVRHGAPVLGAATHKANNCPRGDGDALDEIIGLIRCDAIGKDDRAERAAPVVNRAFRALCARACQMKAHMLQSAPSTPSAGRAEQ